MTAPVRHIPTNRIATVMEHTNRYAFKRIVRLAADAGVSKSAISRLLSGASTPSVAVLLSVTNALQKATGHPIDPRELISFDGTYPTPTVCELVGCDGCMPTDAYDSDEVLKTEFRNVVPGTWSGDLIAGKAA